MLVRQVLGLPGFPIQKLYGEEMKMNVAAKKIKKTKPASWHKKLASKLASPKPPKGRKLASPKPNPCLRLVFLSRLFGSWLSNKT